MAIEAAGNETMRFSLKWVLLGMAYVAVAAAAFSQGHWVYADILWSATFVAICLMILTAIFGSGSRRAGAAGFTLFALGFAGCAQFAQESIPTRRILLAAGVNPHHLYSPFVNPYMQPPISSRYTLAAPSVTVYPQAVNPPPPAVAPAPVPVVTFPVEPVELPFNSKLRAANSVGAMLIGLAGGWLAAAAYRRHRTGSESSAA